MKRHSNGLTGRKWKKNLETLISFIDEYKHIFGRKELYSLPISCKNKNLLNIFGNERNVSNMLELAQKVDLLKCTDDRYQFNAYNDELNFCKRYICNKKVQDLIIQLANKYNIVIYKYKNYKRNEKTKFSESNSINIAINSKLNLRVPNMTDDEVIAWLDKRYPQIAEYQQLADELNEYFYHDDKERRIQFIPTIKRSRGNSSTITKIGIRATNSLVSLKEHDNGKETNKVWRKDWLNEHYGKDNWICFDVKSSIFRINYFINTGIWIDNNIDLYEMMYGKKFDSPEKRNEYKSIAMSLYFEKTIGTLYTHLINKVPSLRMFDSQALKLYLNDMHNQMLDAIGRTYDSEIFLHESCIYMELQRELLEQGFDVTVVYDGFYVQKTKGMTEKDFSELCCSILKEQSRIYEDNYLI